MASNVISFPGVTRPDLPARAQPNEDAIVVLERWLARVRNGEIVAVALTGVCADGSSTMDCWSAIPQAAISPLISGTALLHHRLCSSISGDDIPAPAPADDPA